MAIKSITTIQSPNELPTNFSNEYILQSLANLGQRQGLRGEGIKSGTFTVKDILVNYSSLDPSKHAFVIYTQQGIEDVFYGYVDYTVKLDELYIKASDVVSYSTDKMLLGKLTLPLSIYKTASFANNSGDMSVVVKEDKYYYSCLIGYDDNGQLTDIAVNKFSIDGLLYQAVNIIQYNGKRYVAILNYNNNKYVLSLYSTTETLDAFRNTINLYAQTYKVPYPTEVFNYIEVKYGSSLNHITPTEGIELSYNTSASQYFSNVAEVDESYADVVRELLSQYSANVALLCDYIKELYSENVYYTSNTQLYTQIVTSLFKRVKQDYNCDRLVIPLDYEFSYFGSDSNADIIVSNATDIYVNIISSQLTNNYIYDQGGLKMPTCFNGLIDTVALYGFGITYDNNDTNASIITDINVYAKYIMPYIDNNGYWVINNISTSISAKGKDAGNPNMILIYCPYTIFDSGTTTPEILVGANKDVLKNLKWEETVTTVQRPEIIDLTGFKTDIKANKYFNVKCSIPDFQHSSNIIEADLINMFENSLLVCISDTACISVDNDDEFKSQRDEIIDIYGENGTVTTLWTFDVDKKQFCPVYMDGVTLDILTLTDYQNVMKWHVKHANHPEPDNYEYTYLIFDSSYTQLKNSLADYNEKIYATFRNKWYTEYGTNYSNKLNFALEYNDTVEGLADRNITRVTNSNNRRYINTSTFGDKQYNTIATTNTVHKAITQDEYLPNVNCPNFDVSEILLNNVNTINRNNILTFDSDGIIYNSYIGVPFDTSDKNILHIGSSSRNINIGTKSMIWANQNMNFKPQNALSLDFPYTYIQGITNISGNTTVEETLFTYHSSWRQTNSARNDNGGKLNTETRYYTTTFVPSGRFISESNDSLGKYSFSPATPYDDLELSSLSIGRIIFTDNDDTKKYVNYLNNNIDSILEYAEPLNKLWISEFIVAKNLNGEGNNTYYYGDGIYLPMLLKQLNLNNVDLSKVKISSNTLDIIQCGTTPIIINTNEYLLAKYISGGDGQSVRLSNYTGQLFVGAPLNITYYYDTNNILNMTIETTKQMKIRNWCAPRFDSDKFSDGKPNVITF